MSFTENLFFCSNFSQSRSNFKIWVTQKTLFYLFRKNQLLKSMRSTYMTRKIRFTSTFFFKESHMKQNPDYLNDEFEANDSISTTDELVYFSVLICQIFTSKYDYRNWLHQWNIHYINATEFEGSCCVIVADSKSREARQSILAWLAYARWKGIV